MERRTAIATAGGATLGLAAIVAVLAVNAGAMSSSVDPAEGPGSFEPVSEQTTTSESVTTLPEVTTVYVDENGNIVEPPGAAVPAPSAGAGTAAAPSGSGGSATPSAPATTTAPTVAATPRYADDDDEYEYEEHEYEGHDDDD
jgi:hypothetical protein